MTVFEKQAKSNSIVFSFESTYVINFKIEARFNVNVSGKKAADALSIMMTGSHFNIYLFIFPHNFEARRIFLPSSGK